MIGSKIISTIGPNIACEASIYVDDIEQAGSHINTIEGTARNCGTVEIWKTSESTLSITKLTKLPL